MAHGKNRSFIGGVVVGIGLTVASSLALIYGLDVTFGPPGYPHFTAKSARTATIEWARLSPFPEKAESFTIVTGGGMFSREFRVSFFGNPQAIADWVQSCPGVTDPKTTKTEAPDGTITYEMLGGGGAEFAELIHHPTRGTISIRTYWS
ncbi:MAG: hypothetical protein NTV80_21330 [Verrucomicrobia bacterium]|nr:hypothetical protein [Verrucomicrobiota bacterium]